MILQYRHQPGETIDAADYPLILYADHPLSLGWTLRLVSDSRWTRPALRRSIPFEIGEAYEAVTSTRDALRCDLIILPDRDVSLHRHVALCAHECSHVVDRIFARAEVDQDGPVNSEVRAYYLDWVLSALLETSLLDERAMPRAPGVGLGSIAGGHDA